MRPQSTLHPSRRTTFHYCIASKAIRKGGIFQGYSAAAFVYHRRQDRPDPLQRASQGCCRGNRPGQAFLIRFHPITTYLPSHRWVFPVGLEGGKCTRPEIFKRKKIRFHERHSFGFEASTGEGDRRDPTRIVSQRGLERIGEWVEGERKEREYPCMEHRDGR